MSEKIYGWGDDRKGLLINQMKKLTQFFFYSKVELDFSRYPLSNTLWHKIECNANSQYFCQLEVTSSPAFVQRNQIISNFFLRNFQILQRNFNFLFNPPQRHLSYAISILELLQYTSILGVPDSVYAWFDIASETCHPAPCYLNSYKVFLHLSNRYCNPKWGFEPGT